VIIHQDADVYQIGKLAHRRFERFLRVVCGQHYRDAFPINHPFPRTRTTSALTLLR
jgi:hypothetical protein